MEVIQSHDEIPHPDVGQIVTVETVATGEAGSSDTQSTDAEQLCPMRDSQEVTSVVHLNYEGTILCHRSGIVPPGKLRKSLFFAVPCVIRIGPHPIKYLNGFDLLRCRSSCLLSSQTSSHEGKVSRESTRRCKALSNHAVQEDETTSTWLVLCCTLQ